MLLRALIVSLLAAGTGGCASVLSLSSSDAYPVYGNPVNPTPVPGYRVVCRTYPSPEILHFTSAYGAGCTQVVVPDEVVVRTRG